MEKIDKACIKFKVPFSLEKYINLIVTEIKLQRVIMAEQMVAHHRKLMLHSIH